MIEFVHPTPWNLPPRRAVIKVRRVTGPRGSWMSGMAADEEVATGLVSGEEDSQEPRRKAFRLAFSS